MFLVIQDHRDSIESIERDGQIVKALGNGMLKSPGHPSGNQSNERQIRLLRGLSVKPYLISIFNIDLEKKIEYLGEYSLLNYEIKRSFEGFRYYMFTMRRVIKSKPGVEAVFPPLKEECHALVL